MTGYLNQNEIDDLLGAGSDQGSSKGKFDFSNQQRIIRGKIPALDIVNDRFARSYQRVVTRRIGISASVAPSDVKAMKMADFLKNLLQPTSLNICKLKPFEGGSITVVMEAKLIYDVMNVYYGGNSGRHHKIEGQDFHPIEKEYIKVLLVEVYQDYVAAWEPLQKVEIEQIYSDSNPSFESTTTTNDTVYVSRVTVSFEGRTGSIYFCIPLTVLRGHLDKLDEAVKSYQGGVGINWRPIIAKETLDYRLSVDCVVGQSVLRLSDLASLNVGDVIPISMYDQAVVVAGGQPLFYGQSGVSSNNLKAVKVSKVLSHPERGDVK